MYSMKCVVRKNDRLAWFEVSLIRRPATADRTKRLVRVAKVNWNFNALDLHDALQIHSESVARSCIRPRRARALTWTRRGMLVS